MDAGRREYGAVSATYFRWVIVIWWVFPVNESNGVMAKAHIHAESSARKFGGTPENYMDIHVFMDISKGSMPDNRHRALTHNAWFIMHVLPRVFGETISVLQTLPDGTSRTALVSVRDVGEQHVLEDFGNKFIPSAQDYLAEMEFKDWMNNGKGSPPSFAKINRSKSTTRVSLNWNFD